MLGECGHGSVAGFLKFTVLCLVGGRLVADGSFMISIGFVVQGDGVAEAASFVALVTTPLIDQSPNKTTDRLGD